MRLNPTIKPLCRSRSCCPCKLHVLSSVESSNFHIQHAALAIHTFSWKHTHILSLFCVDLAVAVLIYCCVSCCLLFMVSYLSMCSAVLPAGGIVAMNNNKMASIAQCGVTSESLSTSSSLMVSAKCNT